MKLTKYRNKTALAQHVQDIKEKGKKETMELDILKKNANTNVVARFAMFA